MVIKSIVFAAAAYGIALVVALFVAAIIKLIFFAVNLRGGGGSKTRPVQKA